MRRIGIVLLTVWFMWVVKADAENKNLVLRGRLETSYNDNVTLAHRNVVSDMVQSVLLGLDFKRETDRNSFLLQADAARNFYLDNGSFDNTEINFRATDRYELSSRMRLNITDHYNRAEDPQSFADAFGRTSGRYRTDDNNLNAKYGFDLNSHMLFELEYINDVTVYSRSDLDNSVFNQFHPRLQYALDESNRVGIGYGFTMRDFESGSQVSGHTIIADFGHSFTKQLEWGCKIGEDFANEDTGGTSQQARYEVSLINDINETTNAALKYRRGLSSYAYSKDLFDSYQVSATLAREVTSRVFVRAAGFYGEGDYQNSGIHDELLGAGVGINYATSPQSSVGLNYNFARTRSNQEIRSYDRNFVGVQFEIKI